MARNASSRSGSCKSHVPPRTSHRATFGRFQRCAIAAGQVESDSEHKRVTDTPPVKWECEPRWKSVNRAGFRAYGFYIGLVLTNPYNIYHTKPETSRNFNADVCFRRCCVHQHRSHHARTHLDLEAPVIIYHTYQRRESRGPRVCQVNTTRATGPVPLLHAAVCSKQFLNTTYVQTAHTMHTTSRVTKPWTSRC